MLTYKTDRHVTTTYLIKQWLISLIILSLPVLIDYLLSKNFIKPGYYWIVAPPFIFRVIIQINTRRLVELKIDVDNGHIFFVYKTAVSRPKTTALAIRDACLEIAKSKSKFFKMLEPVTLSFLKNKEEIFELNNGKDGFSVETLMQVAATAQSLQIPFKYV